ncbi:hypothetical protein B0H10DRAFT_1939904 [Mycena sp. CBHHK59/15]|nr:hypothetical protein B0H10DRAFT_1939904 [Mycena sp. CBHHK59/15]
MATIRATGEKWGRPFVGTSVPIRAFARALHAYIWSSSDEHAPHASERAHPSPRRRVHMRANACSGKAAIWGVCTSTGMRIPVELGARTSTVGRGRHAVERCGGSTRIWTRRTVCGGEGECGVKDVAVEAKRPFSERRMDKRSLCG